MKNLFVVIGDALAKVGDFVADAVKNVTGFAAKVSTVLAAEKPLEAPFLAALSAVVADVEALIADAGSAVTADGLNFSADSAAYKAFLQLLADAKTLVPIAEQAVAILEGKAAPVVAAEVPEPGDAVVTLNAAAPAVAAAAVAAPAAAAHAVNLGPRVLQHGS